MCDICHYSHSLNIYIYVDNISKSDRVVIIIIIIFVHDNDKLITRVSYDDIMILYIHAVAESRFDNADKSVLLQVSRVCVSVVVVILL